MNYSVSAKIYDQVDLNAKEKGPTGSHLPPNIVKMLQRSSAFNVSTGVTGPSASSSTYTSTELKAKIKESMKLPDTVVDVQLTIRGATAPESGPITSYAIGYEATMPYVPLPEKPEKTTESSIEDSSGSTSSSETLDSGVVSGPTGS